MWSVPVTVSSAAVGIVVMLVLLQWEGKGSVWNFAVIQTIGSLYFVVIQTIGSLYLLLQLVL